ncbi:hypothetical protein JCM18899A_32960 [Nocardioides sp. AN3]
MCPDEYSKSRGIGEGKVGEVDNEVRKSFLAEAFEDLAHHARLGDVELAGNGKDETVRVAANVKAKTALEAA